MTDLYDLLTGNDSKGGYMDSDNWFYGNKKKEDRMAKFWIIFVEHTDGGRHYRHSTLESAETEAERLARLPDNQGLAVYIFGCEGKCQAQEVPVRWEIPR